MLSVASDRSGIQEFICIMASQHPIPFSAETLTGRAGKTGNQEPPVVQLAFAKLVILGAALALFTPYWLNLLLGLVEVNWVALRLVTLGGSALVVALAVLFVKVWVGLLKHLARAD